MSETDKLNHCNAKGCLLPYSEAVNFNPCWWCGICHCAATIPGEKVVSFLSRNYDIHYHGACSQHLCAFNGCNNATKSMLCEIHDNTGCYLWTKMKDKIRKFLKRFF